MCRNHRIKRLVPCRCLDGHVIEPYEMSMGLGARPWVQLLLQSACTSMCRHMYDWNIVNCDVRLTWKEKEMHIPFKCYLYQRCIVCLNESVFEMLSIHIWTHHCETFQYKQTMCMSRVNGKSDRGNASEIQAVCNNRKNWFFKWHSFWQFGINWKLLNVNIPREDAGGLSRKYLLRIPSVS